MLRPPLKPKRPVTIGIGFVAKDNTVVLACDSQMTWPGYKQAGYEKLVRIAFPADHFAGLLKAGDWEWANLFHETLAIVAATFPIEDEYSIRRACDKALVETRKKILDAYSHPALEPGAASKWLGSRECKFIVAYVHHEKPFFYTMDLEGAVPCPVFHNFAAIGSGAELASYILNNIDTRQADFLQGFAIGIYVVEQCCKHSANCGRPTMALSIEKRGPWNRLTSEFYDRFLAAVQQTDREMFGNLAAKIHSVAMSLPKDPNFSLPEGKK